MNFNFKELFPSKIFKKKKPDFILWSSANYFSQVGRLEKSSLEASLNWDLITFLEEYVGMKDKKIYPYGDFGVMDAYHMSTVEVCQNHEEKLKRENKKTERAKLETKIAINLEQWRADESVPIGQKFVAISPRGEEDEEYPGLDPENYVFINVHQKIGENEFQKIQYTSYALNSELFQLQDEFITNLGGSYFAPMTQTNNESHQIISRQIILPPTTSFDQIEDTIYDNEDNWVTTRKDLPQVDTTKFNQEMKKVLQMLLDQFWILAEESPQVAIQQFDSLITIVRKHFLKWVEDHAENYPQPENFFPYSLNITMILDHWEIEIKKMTQKIDNKEKKKLKKINQQVKLNPLLPLNRVSSVAHCIVGSPVSLVAKAFKLNTRFLSINSPEFTRLEQEKKQSLLDQILSENMTEIKLDNGETWMVPASFLEGKGCYVDEHGVAMGPCDIPLADSFAFEKTKAEFDQFVLDLQQELTNDKIDQLEKTVETQKGLNHSEKEQFQSKLALLKKLLFKPIISLTELITGDIYSSLSAHNNSLESILVTLNTSQNPLTEIDQIIIKIAQKDRLNLLSDQNGVLKLQEI